MIIFITARTIIFSCHRSIFKCGKYNYFNLVCHRFIFYTGWGWNQQITDCIHLTIQPSLCSIQWWANYIRNVFILKFIKKRIFPIWSLFAIEMYSIYRRKKIDERIYFRLSDNRGLSYLLQQQMNEIFGTVIMSVGKIS